MPEYLAPGVYVEEVESGARPIEGVSTSTAGFLGETERGPTTPEFVESFADFERTYGGFALTRPGGRLQGTYLPYAVRGFFDNGGTRCYVGRVVPGETATASANLAGATSDGPAPEAPVLDRERIDFGSALIGDGPGTLDVTFDNPDGNDPIPESAFQVRITDDGSDDFDFEYTPGEVGSDEAKTVRVTFEPTAAPGPRRRTATLVVEYGYGATPTEELRAELIGDAVDPANGEHRFTTDGLTVDFDPVIVAGEASANVQITNRSGSPVPRGSIAVTSDAEPEFQAALATDPPGDITDSGSVDVVVTFTPDAGDPAPDRSATVTVSHDGVEQFTIEVRGEARSPLARESPAGTLDFGTVPTDARAARTVTFVNEGDDPIPLASDQIDLAVEGDSGFDASVDRTTELPSGEEVDVTVTFQPGDADTRRATLSFASPAGSPPVTVPLVGNAGAAAVTAVGPGEWGANVAVLVDTGTLDTGDPDDERLFKLTVRYWTDDAAAAAARANGADPDNDGVPDATVEEVYDDVSAVETASNYYVRTVNAASSIVRLTRKTGAPLDPAAEPTWLGAASDTAAITVDDYAGEDNPGPGEHKTGLAAFEAVDDISIVCIPDERSSRVEGNSDPATGLTNELVTHCQQTMKDRFAVLQSPQTSPSVGSHTPPIPSEYAAYYYPWIEVMNPATNTAEFVPPGGHVAGIYARSDAQRGVHKAPANEVVRGVSALQATVSKSEQDVLNPKGVNCIRSFPDRGIRLWGARTASRNPNWKYVNVRRLFLYIEESLDEGTQWVVFEPNNEALWARVRQTVSNFLTTVWRTGALMGSTADEAFYVRCDRTTMTQDDIDNGRLIVEIGVAPTKPAEFVILRITQSTAESA